MTENERIEALRVRDVERAKITDPVGARCGRCGGANDLADDVGWWYWMTADGEAALCRACVRRFGLTHNGER